MNLLSIDTNEIHAVTKSKIMNHLFCKSVRRQATAFCCGVALSLMAISGFADDTEVFYGQITTNAADADNAPNVLFVLDNSESMRAFDDGQEGTRLTRLRLAMDEILTQVDNVNIGLMTLNGSDGGGPVRYPVTPIGQSVCDDGGCDEVLVYSQIDGDTDDVFQSVSSGDVTTDSTGLTIGRPTGGGQNTQIVGLRFTEVGIPQGAVITGAVLEVDAQESNNSSSSITVWADDSESADAFSTSNGDLTNRVRTDATVSYDPGRWTAGETYESADLSSVIQEVVNRDDWCGGNDMALLLSGTNPRTFLSQEGVAELGAGDTATLRLTYDASALSEGEGCVFQTDVYQVTFKRRDAQELLSTGLVSTTDERVSFPNTGSDQNIVAVGFTPIQIEQGAEIADARIEFTVAASGAGTPRIRINAENTGDASTLFQNNSKSTLSAKNLTNASAIWEDTGVALAGSKIYTSDLSALAEEVFAREDWASGNSISFILQGESATGFHTAYMFDGDQKYAPRIYLKKKVYLGAGDTGIANLTVRDDLKNTMNELRTNFFTPMVGAQLEAAQYMIGGPVDYGRTRGGDIINSNFRISHPDSYTGGELYTPPDCESSDPYATECEGEEILNDAGGSGPQYISPIVDSCQTNHIVLLGDGASARDSAINKIHGLIGDSSCSTVRAGDRNCAARLAEWLYDTDHAPDIPGKQEIRTHTIAFNLGGTGAEFYADIAKAGEGEAHTADSADELSDAFTSIISSALSLDTSFTAPAVTVSQFNRLSHRDDLYYAVFQASETPRWEGNLKRYKLGTLDDETAILDYYADNAVDDETGYFSVSARSFWEHLDDDGSTTTSADGVEVSKGGAGSRIGADGIDDRNVYIVVGDGSAIPSGGIQLASGNDDYKLHETNDLITSSKLGIAAISPVEDREAFREKLIKWMRGVDQKDQDSDDDFEESRRHMGDPLHTSPVIVTYDTTGSTDDQSVIYVTTNEGFLHAIDSETGDELWAFSPEELLENHYLFYDNSLATTHPYGLDGPLSLYRDEDNDDLVIESGESVYLYSAMRRGGSNYYAFDISNPVSPVLQWVIKGGPNGTAGFEELGQSWSEATKTRILFEGEERDVLIFGGGYDTNQDADPIRDSNGNAVTMEQTDDSIGRALFIVDAVSGSLLWSVTGPDIGTGATTKQRMDEMTFGIPGAIRIVDVDSDGLADQLYASDTGGQLWRFDVISDSSDGEDLLQGGVVADISVSDKEGQRRFYSEPDAAYIQEDGSSYMAISIGSGWRDHPLNDVVEDSHYVFRSPEVFTTPDDYGTKTTAGFYRPIVEDDLVQINNGSTNASTDYDNGWFIRLPDAGEKQLNSSIIFDNIVYFTTYVPDADVAECAAGVGSGFFYALSVFDGSPSLDFDEDGTIESFDSSGSSDDLRYSLEHLGIPTLPSILIADGQDPAIFVGVEKVPSDITNETERTFWVDSGVE